MNHGDIYAYNKDNSKYGVKGEKYIILHPKAQMKVNDQWVDAVVYCPADDRPKVFCREKSRFEQNFVKSI